MAMAYDNGRTLLEMDGLSFISTIFCIFILVKGEQYILNICI